MKLLEQICDKIDGAQKFVLNMCIYMADYALNKNGNQTMADFPNLADISDGKFAQLADQESVLDVSLLVLITLAYQLIGRDYEK